jgi:hypothetical protein
MSLMPIAHPVEQAARARRLAIAINGDPAALRLVQLAEELEAQIAGLPNPAHVSGASGQGAQTAAMITRLPDDIEQYLLDVQRLRATHALMARRGLTLTEARTEIGRWLNERMTPDDVHDL